MRRVRQHAPGRGGVLTTNDSVVWLAIAAMAAAASGAIWWVFLRPVARRQARGVITQKVFKPASTYWQQPTGMRDGFWTPVRIPIAESFVFAVRLDERGEGRPEEAWYSANVVEAGAFDVGQKVEIDYQERGVPGVWKRVYVVDMRAV